MIAVERQVALKYRPLWSVCCDSSGRIYVLEGWGGGKIIHVYSMEGEHLQEIRRPGLREDEWIQSIACHEQAMDDVTLVIRTDDETKRGSLLRVSIGVFPHRHEP
jgi:sugar lactone lactonase YvrE